MSEEMLVPDAVTARVDRARAELLLARDATDAKRVADMARAAEVYARRQKLGREAIAYATTIVIDAMTVMGEFLRAAKDAGEMNTGVLTQGGGEGAGGSMREPPATPTLADMGITKKESMLSQRLVEVREKLPSLYEQIRAGGVSVSKAVAAVRRHDVSKGVVVPTDDDPCCTVDDLRKLVARGDRFGTIYADPPWQYGNQATRAATDNHYPTMTLEDIAALPVGDLAAEKAHLHLWTTDSFLEPAIELLKGWGFERRQTFVWVKPQLGIGNYWRSSHEYMLLGIRGGLTFPPSNVMSWGEWPRQEHSAKPEGVRRLIEQMSPGPRLEMFGRKVSPGWVVWGNQIRRALFDPAVRAITEDAA